MKTLNIELRKKILEKGYQNNMSHYGSALSCVDAIKYLYDNVLKEEDVFILSKGHGAMALYAVLESKGKNPDWTEHPELNEKKGIYATTGSLGHGLPIATGRAFAKKIKGEKGRVYVLTGDGEMEEGSNWEAMMIANSLKVNLNILVDWNKYQAIGDVDETTNINGKSLEKKLSSFGFKTKIINGHTINGLKHLKELEEGCNAIILNTIKGKGISILEREHNHVYNWKNEEEYLRDFKELK
jgi:transketolase